MLNVGFLINKTLVWFCRFWSPLSHRHRVSGGVCDRHDSSCGRVIWGSVRSGLSTFGQRSNGKFTPCAPHFACARVCFYLKWRTDDSVLFTTVHRHMNKVDSSGTQQVLGYLQIPYIPAHHHKLVQKILHVDVAACRRLPSPCTLTAMSHTWVHSWTSWKCRREDTMIVPNILLV